MRYLGFVQPAPLFELYIGAAETGIVRVAFGPPEGPGWVGSDDHPLVREAALQLKAYFDGKLREFDLPLDPRGTAFQNRVWSALRAIPYGETRRYSRLARDIGAPRAFRAVGAANGANPLAIVVPCHRVIAAGGSLGGYGGGLDRKQFLLDLESRVMTAERNSSAPSTSTPILSR